MALPPPPRVSHCAVLSLLLRATVAVPFLLPPPRPPSLLVLLSLSYRRLIRHIMAFVPGAGRLLGSRRPRVAARLAVPSCTAGRPDTDAAHSTPGLPRRAVLAAAAAAAVAAALPLTAETAAAASAKKPVFEKTDSGLRYTDVKKGTGPYPGVWLSCAEGQCSDRWYWRGREGFLEANGKPCQLALPDGRQRQNSSALLYIWNDVAC